MAINALYQVITTSCTNQLKPLHSSVNLFNKSFKLPYQHQGIQVVICFIRYSITAALTTKL